MENPQLNTQAPDALIRAVLQSSEPEPLSLEAYARIRVAVQDAWQPITAPLPVRPLLSGTAWWGVGVLAMVLVGLGLLLPMQNGVWKLPLPQPHTMRVALMLCLAAWAVLVVEKRLRQVVA